MIYLDNAATTLMKPPCVSKSVYEAINNFGSFGRTADFSLASAAQTVFDCRGKIAAFFGFSYPQRVCFSLNSTESLNTAIKGIKKEGLIVSTTTEHNSVLRPLYELEKNGRKVYLAGCGKDGCVDSDDLISHIDENTAFVVLNHASNVTGNVCNIAEIGARCRACGALLVLDTSQSAGHIKINMEKENIDVCCFTGHKGLFGPQGTGGILVGKSVDISPLKSGGTGVLSTLSNQPENYPEHLEAGTLNAHGIAGLLSAVEWLGENTDFAKKALKLSNLFAEGIANIQGVKIFGSFKCDRVPVVSIAVRNYDSSQVSRFLYDRYAIITRSGIHCAPLLHKELGTENRGLTRFSFSCFNTENDVDTAVEAVKEAAK